MSRVGFYVLCGALCSLVVLGQGQGSQTTDVTPVAKINTTSTEAPSPPTSPPTTPPTTKPPTTTPPPPTTPPTTPPTPPPTTPKPTPPPGPLPPPSQGNWSYEEKNITCIVVQFAAKLNVTYTKAVDNSTTLDHVCLNVPKDAKVINGSCSANNATQQFLTLSWKVGELPPSNMTLVFLKNGTNYALHTLNITLPSGLFPNASSNNSIELSHGVAWQTPLATSYRCGTPTGLNLTAESQTVGTLTISQLQEEAFRTVHDKGFSAARDCGSGDVPDAVPIAVGCALGGLVVVVLVAYLVGRRRSAARGYLSM